jgi:hypothetical protein
MNINMNMKKTNNDTKHVIHIHEVGNLTDECMRCLCTF